MNQTPAKLGDQTFIKARLFLRMVTFSGKKRRSKTDGDFAIETRETRPTNSQDIL